MKQILLRIASFFRDESCGQCVPCRVGAVRQEEALERLSVPAAGFRDGRDRTLREMGQAMRDASICGLGPDRFQRDRIRLESMEPVLMSDRRPLLAC